jgi:hypothetical protein
MRRRLAPGQDATLQQLNSRTAQGPAVAA